MHPRAERFLAHIEGQGDVPPVLCMWRGEEYLGMQSIPPEKWIMEVFDPVEGAIFADKAMRAAIRAAHATAVLLYLPGPSSAVTIYAEPTLCERYRGRTLISTSGIEPFFQ